MLLRIAIILSLVVQGLLADAGGACAVRLCGPEAAACAPSCCEPDGASSGGSSCCCTVEDGRTAPAESKSWLVRVGERVVAPAPTLETSTFGRDERGWLAPSASGPRANRWVSTPERLSLLCVRTT